MIEIENTVVVPGFVAYPYLDDPFDDIDNQDKYLLHNILEPLSYSFSGPLLYSGFNHCIRHLTLFQNEHHLYNEYKSHFISQLSAITDSSCIEKKRISGAEYASMFYFTVLHKSSFVPFYKCELVNFVSSTIGILCHISRLCREESCRIQGYINSMNCIQSSAQKLECLVRYFLGEIDNLVKTIDLWLELFRSLNNLGFCLLDKISLGSCLEKLGVLIEFNTETFVSIKYSMKRLGSVVFDSSKLSSIKSELGTQREQIQSLISKLSCVMCWVLCNKSPEDILKELTSIIKSIGKTLECISVLIKEFRYIIEIDCGTLDCILTCSRKIEPSLKDIKVRLALSLKIFVFPCWFTDYLGWLGYSIGFNVGYFLPRVQKIKGIVQRTESTVFLMRRQIVSHFRNFNKIVDSIESVISSIDYYWSELDSFIEVKPFLKCSLKSIKANISELEHRFIRENKDGSSISRDTMSVEPNKFTSKHLGYIHDSIWSLMSNMTTVESKLVSSYLYEISKSIKETLQTLKSADKCYCVFYSDCDYDKEKYSCRGDFKSRIPSDINISNLHKFHSNHKNKEGNNICLCLIIKYILVPNLLNCFRCFYDINFGLISTHARKFDGYDRPNINIMRISKLAFFILGIIEKVVLSMEKRYLLRFDIGGPSCEQGTKPQSLSNDKSRIDEEIKSLNQTPSWVMFIFQLIYSLLWVSDKHFYKLLRCFCKFPKDNYYEYFVSIILFICHLIENIVGSDSKMLDNSIQYSLNMVADYYSMDIDPHRVDISDPSAGGEKITYGTSNISLKFSGIIITDNTLILTLGYSSTDAKKFIGNAMSEFFGTIKYVISSVTIQGPTFNLFYDKFGAMSFKLINTGMVNLETKNYIRKTNLFLSNQYILRVRSKTSKLEGICTSREQSCDCDTSCNSKIVCILLSFEREKYNLISSQLIKYSILHFLDGKSPDIYRIAGDINRNTINTTEIITKTSKNTRITEATQKMLIPNEHEESAGNNNYTYNDAYRINTSRAHGSLKYIIIKIVLILIIVVMTIFIRVKIETNDDYKITNDFGIDEDNSISICVSI